MKKETIVLLLIALVVGGLVGVIITNAKTDLAPGNPSVAAVPSGEYQQKIQMLEGVVKKEPKNRGAWVQLGHNYS